MSHDRMGRPVVCSLGLQVSSAQETQRNNSESDQIRTFLCDKESRFSLTAKQRFENTDSRRITTEEVLNETIESQKEEICRAHQGDERGRQDQQLLHEQL